MEVVPTDKPAWDCRHCGQRNAGWVTICGRCEKPNVKYPYNFAPVYITVDEEIEEWLERPYCRFLLWWMKFLGRRLVNSIHDNCGIIDGR